MSLKANLTQAKRNKKDEFYTQLKDIENELRHYKDHFKGKTVYCNADDPRVSNFFHYFSYNFEHLGLKKLITTCYKNQEMDLFSMHDYVFISLKEGYFGKPLKYQSVLDLVRRIVKRTGIEFTSHMLRHTHATQLIREGWDVAFVQKRLGHAHVQTTLNTYVHLSDQDMKNEFNKYLERKEHKK